MPLRTCRLALTFAALWAGDARAVAPATPATPETVAFVHASVVPMDRERVLADHTVVVTSGRIVAVGPDATTAVPGGALRIDARGRHLLPALSDMHVHVEGESWNALLTPEAMAASRNAPLEDFLFPFVANGVTTVQVLSGTHELLPLRGRIAEGEVLAPRLVLARMIDGPGKAWPPPLAVWVANAEEARAATIRAKAEGYDKMKVYSFLDKPSYDAVIATAREQGMDVVGHVPDAVPVEYAVASGQRMIAHTEEVAKQAHGDYSARKIDYYAGLIADGHVYMTPTLVTSRAILEELDGRSGLFSRPESAYSMHPMQAGIWSFIAGRLYANIPAAAREKLHRDFEHFQRPLTKAFHDHGGQLMTGTDALMPRLVAGYSLHRELKELVDVGLTPYEALRTSTTVPYEFLREADDAGTIEVGKRTDLLLVDGDPLADVAAAAHVEGVLMRGRWVGKDEIEARMRAIRERNTAPAAR
jgi:imidazolonepropionase-like amidohydrolase